MSEKAIPYAIGFLCPVLGTLLVLCWSGYRLLQGCATETETGQLPPDVSDVGRRIRSIVLVAVLTISAGSLVMLACLLERTLFDGPMTDLAIRPDEQETYFSLPERLNSPLFHHQHYQPLRPVDAENQLLLDVRRAAGAGDKHDLAAGIVRPARAEIGPQAAGKLGSSGLERATTTHAGGK